MTVPPDVPVHDLKSFIESARWFGGKGREFEVTAVRRLGWVATGTSARASIELVTLTFDDAPEGQAEELYQVPLAFYAERQERLSHATALLPNLPAVANCGRSGHWLQADAALLSA